MLKETKGRLDPMLHIVVGFTLKEEQRFMYAGGVFCKAKERKTYRKNYYFFNFTFKHVYK
jgi:hypothetical protein